MSIHSDLENEYKKYYESIKKSREGDFIDLSSVNWFYPTFLLPLGIFMNQNPKTQYNHPNDPDIAKYFDIMLNESNTENFGTKNYIPLIKLPQDKEMRDEILHLFLEQKTQVGGKDAFFYIISELSDNIFQHSDFSTAFIMAQQYPKKEFTEIAIIDNGISIPGSYEKKKYNFTDVQALEEAMKGLSTKNTVERGYGLRTTIKLLREGLNAECLIISRNAKLTYNTNQEKLEISESSYNQKGTLISTRIPLQDKDIDIYDYVD